MIIPFWNKKKIWHAHYTDRHDYWHTQNTDRHDYWHTQNIDRITDIFDYWQTQLLTCTKHWQTQLLTYPGYWHASDKYVWEASFWKVSVKVKVKGQGRSKTLRIHIKRMGQSLLMIHNVIIDTYERHRFARSVSRSRVKVICVLVSKL
jgi:hypothetical protein